MPSGMGSFGYTHKHVVLLLFEFIMGARFFKFMGAQRTRPVTPPGFGSLNCNPAVEQIVL